MTTGDTISSPKLAFLAASPRLFSNPVLDRLSRVHHLVPVVLYLPVVALLLSFAAQSYSAVTVVAAFLGGYVLWTLVEYCGHRFVFHFRFVSRAGRRAEFLVHGVHHDHPNDPLRLVMPPLMSVPIMIIAWVAVRAALGPILYLPVLSGFIAGYLAYDMLHYHLHHGRPRTAIGRFLRLRHMHHHFRDGAKSFGVSAPWWDYVFGTQLPRAHR